MDKKLEKKILELFRYRRFPLLFKEGGTTYDKSELKDLLVKLQADIYHLDHYLESNWKIKKSELKQYWDVMKASLKALGVPRSEQLNYLSHIKKYQKHELSLRDGLSPDRFTLEYFYFYKSCDVKLLRRIIFDTLPGLLSRYPHSDWRSFDLITEVNDDLEDILEDYDCINCNAYLISVYQIGVKQTNRNFKEFIKYIELQNKLRYKKKGASYKLIYQWTQEELKATMKLLSKNAALLSDKKRWSKMKNAILFRRLFSDQR